MPEIKSMNYERTFSDSLPDRAIDGCRLGNRCAFTAAVTLLSVRLYSRHVKSTAIANQRQANNLFLISVVKTLNNECGVESAVRVYRLLRIYCKPER